MLKATLCLAFRYFAFARPSAVFTRIKSPSRSTQTGLTCGEPSDITKARLPKFLPSISLIAFSESLARGMSNAAFMNEDSVIKEMLRTATSNASTLHAEQTQIISVDEVNGGTGGTRTNDFGLSLL